MLRITAVVLIASSALSCRHGAVGSDTTASPSIIPAFDAEAILGMSDENKPAISRIEVGPEAARLPSDWNADTGREYWLFAPGASNTGYMTFGDDTKFHPYGGRCDSHSNAAWCALKPSEVARRCMYQAGKTLKAILDNPPEEWTQFVAGFSELSFFGWMNDGDTAKFEGNPWQGPFNWRSSMQMTDANYVPGGYVKWVSSVTSQGLCKTPSLGQFKYLIRQMRNCATNPGETCGDIE